MTSQNDNAALRLSNRAACLFDRGRGRAAAGNDDDKSAETEPYISLKTTTKNYMRLKSAARLQSGDNSSCSQSFKALVLAVSKWALPWKWLAAWLTKLTVASVMDV